MFLILWEHHLLKGSYQSRKDSKDFSDHLDSAFLFILNSLHAPPQPPQHYQVVELRWQAVSPPYPPQPTRQLVLIPPVSKQYSIPPRDSCFQWAQPGWGAVSVLPLYPELPSVPARVTLLSNCCYLLPQLDFQLVESKLCLYATPSI